MINLIDILKNCPEGTKLYSPLFGEIIFKAISSNNNILCKATKYNGEITTVVFTHLGRDYCELTSAECVLFPSKDQRDWSKFQIPAKRGDIMMFTDKSAVFMIDTKKYNYTNTIAYASNLSNFKIGEHIVRSYIPASEDMKDKLFAAMDEAGYEWDGKTLKKKCQFKPFEKVLVRNNESLKWRCAFYSYFEPYSTYPHVTSNGDYAMCIPFKGNEHLVGTTNNP